jgi:hypothetical protein
LVWDISLNVQPQIIITKKSRQLNQRHIKKYATGFMDYNSFYFTGAECKMNLKAYNVLIFVQLAEGIDHETWMCHLKQNDYSKWFRGSLHDEERADITEKIESGNSDAITLKQKYLLKTATRRQVNHIATDSAIMKD